MIRSSESVKIPDIRVFFKIIQDKNFNTEILDMSVKFRTYGNPTLLCTVNHRNGPSYCC